MAGRHDKAEESPPGMFATGPIAVRGISRGVRSALQPGRESRHRAAGIEPAGQGASGEESEGLHVVDEQGPDEAPAAASSFEDPARSAPATSAQQRVRGDPEHVVAIPSGSDRISGARRGGGSHRPPHPSVRLLVRNRVLIAAAFVALSVACVGLILAVVAKTERDAALAAREAASYSPPPLASTPPAAGPLIAVVGDGGAAGGAAGVGEAERWPALVARALQGSVVVRAQADAGYRSAAADGFTFVRAASEVPAAADYVLFVGGSADARGSALQTAQAATRAFSVAAQRAPGADVIAVGPLFPEADEDAGDLSALRSSLRSSAAVAGIQWVDPIGAGWLSGVDSPSALTASRERSIAARIEAALATGAGSAVGRQR